MPAKHHTVGAYDEHTIKLLEKAISAGMSPGRAAPLAHISRGTYYRWIKEHPEFAERMDRAEAQFIERQMQRIEAASFDSWQAAGWLLERRFPDEFGRRVEEHTGSQEIRVTYTNDWRGGPKLEVADADADA